MPDSSWFKVYRKLLDSEVFADADLLKLFILCVASANFENRSVRVDGLAEPVAIKRGQFVTGRFALWSAYYQGKRRESNRDARTIWRWLLVLESVRCLSVKSSSRYSIVTVVNYDLYQGGHSENVQVDDQPFVLEVSTTKKRKNSSSSKGALKNPDPERYLGSHGPVFWDQGDRRLFGITPPDLVRWKNDYPGADVELELAAMADWLIGELAKPNGGKGIKSSYRQFVTNWLKKASQESKAGNHAKQNGSGRPTHAARAGSPGRIRSGEYFAYASEAEAAPQEAAGAAPADTG